jgi:protoporphyrinogen IX oxidase
MLWFLALHIVALLFWAGSLLYLPALIAGMASRDNAIDEPPNPFGSISRFVFTRLATPAALLTIFAGTLIFLIDRAVNLWLIAKMTLVTGLVIVHCLVGLLILRAESRNDKPLRVWCWLLGVVACLLMIAIIWLVLAKPPLGVLP